MKLLACFFTLIALVLSGVSFGASTHDGYIIKSASIATSTTSIVSSVVELPNANGVAYDKISLHTKFAAGSTATGTVSTYISNDMVGDGRFVTDWILYNAQAVTAATSIFKNFTDIAAKWLKVEYTKDSGTGTGTVSTIIYVP